MNKMSLLRLVSMPVIVVGLVLAMANTGFTQSTSNTTPVVIIRAADANASESGDLGMFIVKREGPTNASLSVFFLVGGSAAPGVDYTNLASPVVIPAGADHAPLVVSPIDDLLREGRESVVVQLVPSPIMGPIEPYRVGYPGNATVWIEDNEPPPPLPVVNIAATDPEASEIPPVPPGLEMPQRIDPAVFTVRRDGNTNAALEVLYRIGGTASNGVDYVRLSGIVRIPPGAIAAPIEVIPLDDLLVEGTETVVLTLEPMACITIYPPPPGCYQVGPSNQAVAHILDNDPATNLPPCVQVAKPIDGQMFLAPANIGIVADTVDRDGYVPHVEFYAGTNMIGEETRLFVIPPPPGQHIIYEMHWTNVPPGRYELRAKATDDQGASSVSGPVHVWVVDTNLPPITNLPIVSITATDPVASEGTNCWRWAGWSNAACTNSCGTNTATFMVKRHGETNTDLTVRYWIGGTASNGVDYVELPGVVTIPAGRRCASITVVPIDDNLVEPIETVVLALRLPVDWPTNVVPPCTIRWPWKAAAVIVDNDRPRPVTITLPDRCFHIMHPGAKEGWFRVEYSTDMAHWTPICTNMVTDGALHFVDPEAEDSARRFYRAVPETSPPQE